MEIIRKIKRWWYHNDMDLGLFLMLIGVGLVLITYLLDENMITGILSILFLMFGMVIIVNSDNQVI